MTIITQSSLQIINNQIVDITNTKSVDSIANLKDVVAELGQIVSVALLAMKGEDYSN